jgi:hypothetical protein
MLRVKLYGVLHKDLLVGFAAVYGAVLEAAVELLDNPFAESIFLNP